MNTAELLAVESNVLGRLVRMKNNYTGNGSAVPLLPSNDGKTLYASAENL